MSTPEPESAPHPERPPLTTTARIMLVVALALMVVGGGLWLVGRFSDDPAPPPAAAGPAPVIAFGEVERGEPAPPPADGLDAWSPMVFRLGFSFFAGFAMAYALRSFLKVTLIAAGLLLLALFGLQYAGLVDVDWSAMSDRYDGVVGWLRGQTSSFASFVQGYLPSTASGVFGLTMGFRRRR